ncbi:MAG: hypothetical protein HOM51_12885 [Rhodospirillaceae bacterium]|nr:hypothetical protein [Rhodospirillaceae bacterium]
MKSLSFKRASKNLASINLAVMILAVMALVGGCADTAAERERSLSEPVRLAAIKAQQDGDHATAAGHLQKLRK